MEDGMKKGVVEVSEGEFLFEAICGSFEEEGKTESMLRVREDGGRSQHSRLVG